MIYLRASNQSDLPLTLAWRSNPLIFQGFYSQVSPLTWEGHVSWCTSRNQDWRTFIIVLQEDTSLRDIGVVTIGQLDNWSPEIGYYIGETTLWGKGIATEAVRLACDWIKAYGRDYVHTTVLDKNKASIRILEKLGFKRVCDARKGESRYETSL